MSSRRGSNYSELPDRWLFYLNRGTTRLNLPLASTDRESNDATVKANAQLCVDDFKQAELLRGPLKPEAIIVENRAQAYERLGNYNLAIAGIVVHVCLGTSLDEQLLTFSFLNGGDALVMLCARYHATKVL